MKGILELKRAEFQKQLKSILGAIQYLAKFIPRLSERTEILQRLLKKDSTWNWGNQQDNDFNNMKKMFTEEPNHITQKLEKISSQPMQAKPDSE